MYHFVSCPFKCVIEIIFIKNKISKFGPLCAVSEFKNVCETQMVSKLWIRLYAFNRDTLI